MMERFSQRDSILLGYSPQISFINSGSSTRSSHTNSDIDFHDVFGGPPRGSSIQETRYSFGDVAVTSAPKREDDDDDDNTGWSEKPVFGEESQNRRRPHSDDFYDDIFKGSNSVSSSPRRHQRDPYASSQGSRVLSPARPLPPRPESSLGSSLPAQFSLPAKLTKGVDSPPTIGAITRTTSLSRFSSQAFQSPENLKSDLRSSSLCMSHLSQDFSVTIEGSSNVSKDGKDDTEGSTLEQDSKSSESPTGNNLFQFHFSIYKWASKPMVMPLRGRSGSRVQATKNEEQLNTSEDTDNKSMATKSPISTLPSIDFTSIDHLVADSTSSKLESNQLENDVLLDKSTPKTVEVQPSRFVEDTILPVVESSETISSLYTVEDVAGATASCQWPKEDTCSCHWPKQNTISCQTSENIEPRSLLQKTGENPQKQVHALMEQLHKPEMKYTHSLFFDDDLRQGTNEISNLADERESSVIGTKKSSVDVGSSRKVKTENGKRSSLTNVHVDKSGVQGSPQKLGDILGRNKVKGTVKDFVKKFGQEASSKPKDGGDLGSQRFRRKEKSSSESGNEASLSTPIMHDESQNSDVKKTLPDASSIKIKEDLKWSEKEASEEKTARSASIILDNVPKPNVSASNTGSIANCSKANIEDVDESFHETFQIKELIQDEKTPPVVDINHEDLQVIDAKIRKWSSGKEGNIRSLLSTMQHIVWPGSGWKPVPLVDIIEGNAVKRSYQRALLCLHPDKLQQKGATSEQKYIAEKVFDILQEAWNHFNSLGPL
ncbi:J domain-containing protein required for chloroplast accumulation response 1 isoform X1 [Argentina anserina]|uniref:J domain-containing protein required for chloroplast accumulation response 1 isoform X1 n=1 Tax=Argentina anserina TaxID=57926 RepID=UPI0021766DF3|nr:J domain-containing protein required for chloroplast accumulation response 1 isoform X1 [Potentilla anserina]